MPSRTLTLGVFMLAAFFFVGGCTTGSNRYGAPLASTGVPSCTVASLNGEERDVIIEGRITSVCAIKGCWMEARDSAGTPIFVRFRGYAFFVPRNAAGQAFVARGDAISTTVSVAQLRHYAEDAQRPAEEVAAITEPTQRIEFIADSVWIQGQNLDAPYRD